eukprot:1537607-Amphidinium_carterae.1
MMKDLQVLQKIRISRQGLVRGSIAKQWRQKRRERVLADVSDYAYALQHFAKAFRSDREIVLAAVSRSGWSLQWAAKVLRRDRRVVVAAVSQDGAALRWAPMVFRGDREIVLVATSQFGPALRWASKELRSDRKLVLGVVSKYGQSLEWAEEASRSDREIVFAAVSDNGSALQWASQALRDDREIVLAAVAKFAPSIHWASQALKNDREIISAAVSNKSLGSCTLMHAGDNILEDESFQVEARKCWYFIKILALSGISCIVALCDSDIVFAHGAVLRRACGRLGIALSADLILVHGTEIVSESSRLEDWPGSPRRGIMVEYQMIKSKRARGL